jgi:hypothetical protein
MGQARGGEALAKLVSVVDSDLLEGDEVEWPMWAKCVEDGGATARDVPGEDVKHSVITLARAA